MMKCSKWQGGHEQAEAVNEAAPGPDEIDADINFVEDWVRGKTKRR